MYEYLILFQLSLYAEKASIPQLFATSVLDSLAHDLKNIMLNEIVCDFELNMNDGVILKAHKAILIARSSVFHKMLTTDMTEAATNSVDIPDINSKTMRELLHFMYSGEVENLDEIANDLIFAAEKYEIKQLKVLCIDQIITKLTEENVVDALIIADRVSDTDKLLKKCVAIST
jgi:speckle-type POZ protein